MHAETGYATKDDEIGLVPVFRATSTPKVLDEY